MVKSLFVAPLLVNAALAATMTVQVGKSGLVYSPSSVTAAKGDVIMFEFGDGHSVTQSTFAAPCSPMSGGFDTGILASSAQPFMLTVNDTNPVWIYCKASGHCPAGMVFAINAPTSGNTYAMFQQIAEGKATASSSSSASGSATGSATSSASASSTSAASSSATRNVGIGAGFLAAAVFALKAIV